MRKINFDLLTVTYTLTVLFTVDCFAQIQTPQTPTFQQFQPIQPNQSYTPPSNQPNQYQQPNNNQYQPKIKVTKADELIQYGNSPLIPGGQRSKSHREVMEALEDEPGYYHPSAKNNFNQMTPQMKMQYEMMDMLRGIAMVNDKIDAISYYKSEKYLSDLPNYQNAFNKFKDMLEGKTPISVADALYAEEAAYGNLHLSYKEYKQNIAECAAFIKQWMLENGLNPKNPESVHYALQKFMGDTLTIKNNMPDNIGGISIPNSHKPYMYDYIDYRAEEDLHNYFLTKTLATGTGQCNTLPRVYLVLAEALGVEANLTFVHQHSFIKYRNSNGTIENYEPTIDWHMTDNDYTEDMPVMSSAITNKIYLNPLNKKQMVANLMIDLAYNFHREHWTADGKFMSECIDYGMQYFQNGEGHREGLLIKNLVLASQLDRILLSNNINNLNDIEKSPEAVQAYVAYRNSSDKIIELGIQHFPETVYNAMLEKHDKRGKLQIAKNIDTKSKKSLFFNIQTK